MGYVLYTSTYTGGGYPTTYTGGTYPTYTGGYPTYTTGPGYTSGSNSGSYTSGYTNPTYFTTRFDGLPTSQTFYGGSSVGPSESGYQPSSYGSAYGGAYT